MTVTLNDKYLLDKGRAFMSGIEALVRLPILQHQRDQQRGLKTACFISGYRGSPLGGLDQALWKARPFLDKHDIRFQPGINEDLGMTAVWGSQQVNLFPGARYDGVYGMWYGKGPGLDRSMDVLKHANAFGTSKYGGVLAVVGDDHASKSSTLPHQSDHMFIGATCPVLNPASVQEVLDLGIYGWELSRYSGCWVGMKVITENCDAAISAEIDPGRVHIILPEDFEFPPDGIHGRWPDTPLEQEQRLQRFKIYAALAFARANHLNRITLDSPNARFGIVTTGKSYLDTLQALDDLGIDEILARNIGLRLYKVGMSWPLEPSVTHRFAEGLEEILVIEEKRSVIEDQLTGQLYNWPVSRRPRVVGEFDEHRHLLVTNLGELTPSLIAQVIAARIARFYTSDIVEKRLAFLQAKERALASKPAMLERKPWYCSGCPHNTSTVVPHGSMAMAGIGCHYMVQWMDRDTYTFTQMGGEGATWIGQAPFTDTRHVFQNLGDGTYFHSGLLAIRAAISAGVNITYKILYNDAVAMTGGQPVDGFLSVARMAYQLRGEGVKRLAVVSDDPNQFDRDFPRFEGLTIDHRDRLDAIQQELREVPGTSVLIYVQTCAAEKRRRRKKDQLEDPAKRVFINELVCEGCGDCGVQSNCLSVLPKATPLGRKRMIDQSACNKDYSCVKGFCPSFVTVHGGSLRKHRGLEGGIRLSELPDPVLPEITIPYNILVAGIGGTGVLTVGSVLGMAAHIAGLGASVLTQTGLAQKFGAVTSHVRIANRQAEIHGVRIPAGDAHLLLGADLVVSAGQESLARVNSEFSAAVINSHEAPTAEFTRNPDAPFPFADMVKAIRDETGTERTWFIDATAMGSGLLGDAISANMLLLGYAWQLGLIPLSSAAIEQAIALNNVSVTMNLKAFQFGRYFAVNPEKMFEIAGLKAKPSSGSAPSLNEIIDYRYRFLMDYQGQNLADRYRRQVEAVRVAELDRFPECDDDKRLLAHAVAKNYFKLLAYKDEYEVARLFTNGDFERQLREEFEGDFTLRFHLAPPVFGHRDPLTGHLQKREFGRWIMPLFRLLAKLRFLRGTPFDPFAYSQERRTERQLVTDYEDLLQLLTTAIDADNYQAAVELASLPETIRGFGHVKAYNLTRSRERQAALLATLRGAPVKIVPSTSAGK
ncbi:indolepyruvate ferredoxin oxidoreductase family protein [uncultured Porticoccus sp.]|uniref:indolepyruvate ferredoxin oxidoreductase family protein n=1 Tax=uncultured Porticoccus sp. TaxID=1256050 RepID=UPI0026248202|nr:indolepyruvate ferredoxin oxidoreductase family protein [uncultured Porticoccus sp.]